MAKAFLGNTKRKLYLGPSKIKRGYLGSILIYSAGGAVTYHVDSDICYTEEVESGSSCLNPATFTPAKQGWTFAGWREDTEASGVMLSDKVMNDEPVHLYAVFQQDITLTLGMNNSIYSQQTLPRYYNNGYVANPSFTVENPSGTDAVFKGWSSSSDSAGISYAEINDLTLSESTVLYAVAVYEDTAITTSGKYYCCPSGDQFNDTPHIFASGIDCSKYSEITVTLEGYAEANGGSAVQRLWIEAGGTQVKVAESYCDYTGNDCTVDRFNENNTVRTKTISFTQSSGVTDLIGYGTAEVYSQGHGGYLGVFNNTATLTGRTVVG